MRICRRALATFAATLSFIAIALIPGAAASAADWPQGRSDLSPDPSVTFGNLPNGMRYLIKPNNTPTGTISLWLVVDTGSLEENAEQAGMAHFLEHMVFRGSTHFSDGDALKTLQGVGVTRGADFNAFTGDSQTRYWVDLPKNDDVSVAKALSVFRDIASEAQLDPKTVDSERAVVQAEMRLRDTAQARSQHAQMSEVLGSDLAQASNPGGKVSVVQSASADQLRTFYRAWYRPERTTLVVVGAVDPKTMSAAIAKAFGDWRNPAAMPPTRTRDLPALSRPRFVVFPDPNIANAIMLIWPVAHDASADTRARDRRDLARQIGLGILNHRLAMLANGPNPPFLVAGAGMGRDASADTTFLSATVAPGKTVDGLKTLHDAYVVALRDGIHPDELDAAVRAMRAQFDAQLAAASSTPSRALAVQYVATLANGDVIGSPQQQHDLFEEFAKTLTADEVDAALRGLLTDHGPAVFVSGAAPVDGGQDALAAAFAAPVPQGAAPAAVAQSVWPYTHFGADGAVASRTEIPDLGVTQVVFANGVRASIKPTKFTGGQIVVWVRWGKGRLGLPESKLVPAWALAPALLGGGVARIDTQSLSEVAAGKLIGLRFDMRDNAFVLSGTTRPADYLFQLQLLAAQLTDPAWRPEGFERGRVTQQSIFTAANASPTGVLSFRLGDLTHDEDVRWLAPAMADIQAARLEDVKAVFDESLNGSSLEITVVGDITVDDAIKGLQATFAALPNRYPAPTPVVGNERVPPGSAKPLVLTHKGDPGRAVATIAWPIRGFYPDLQLPRTLRVLELVLAGRAFDILRTKAGLTYAPSTSTFTSEATPGFGYLGISAEVPIDKIPDFYNAVAAIVADLRTNPVPQDEFSRVRDPRLEDLVHSQQQNGYWAVVLSGSQGDPRKFDLIRSTIPDMQRVTPADVLAAAKTYLVDDKSFRLVVVPEGQSGSVTTTMR
jgi:zinc protease